MRHSQLDMKCSIYERTKQQKTWKLVCSSSNFWAFSRNEQLFATICFISHEKKITNTLHVIWIQQSTWIKCSAQLGGAVRRKRRRHFEVTIRRMKRKSNEINRKRRKHIWNHRNNHSKSAKSKLIEREITSNGGGEKEEDEVKVKRLTLQTHSLFTSRNVKTQYFVLKQQQKYNKRRKVLRTMSNW